MIYGLEGDALPDGWVPLEAAMVVKCLDEHGIVRLSLQMTDGLNPWEAAGMLSVGAAVTQAEMIDSFEVEDD